MATLLPFSNRANQAIEALVFSNHKAGGDQPALVTREHVSTANACGVRLAGDEKHNRTRALTIGLRDTLTYADFRNELSLWAGDEGAYLRAPGFIDALEVGLYSSNPIRRLATVERISGDEVRKPGVDASAVEGGIAGRDATLQSTPVFSQLVLRKMPYVAQWILPQTLQQDMAPNTARELGNALGQVLGNRQSREWAVGNAGLCASAWPVASSAAGAIGPDDLENLIAASAHYADPDSKTVRFMCHPSIWAALRKLKTGSGSRMWENNRLADFRVALNTAMPATITTGNVPLLFGDFSKFVIADTAEVQFSVFDETLIEAGQVIWSARQMSDGGLLDAGTHPIARLTMSA